MQESTPVNNTKKIAFYVLVIGAFTSFIYFVLQKGTHQLEATRSIATSSADNNYWADFIHGLQHSFTHPLAILLGQNVAIIIAASFFG